MRFGYIRLKMKCIWREVAEHKRENHEPDVDLNRFNAEKINLAYCLYGCNGRALACPYYKEIKSYTKFQLQQDLINGCLDELIIKE